MKGFSLHRLGTALAVALPLGLVACAPERTTSVAGLALQQSVTTSARYANSQRYRNAGAQPVGGRSGSAAVLAEAFLGANGAVQVVATAYRAGDLTNPAGQVTRLQLKAVGPGGRLLLTRNENLLTGNPVVVGVPPLPVGSTLDLLAAVSGIDGRRVDIVPVTGIVPVRAPDLAVTHVDAPPRTIVGAPTIVAATVRETGGAHGASADCVLYVDGQATDRARGIWVDAGDAVSCAFTRAFSSARTSSLRVALEGISPLDGDPTNNAADGSIEVLAASANPPANYSYGVDVLDGVLATSDTFYLLMTDPAGFVVYEQNDGNTSSGHQQSLFVSSTMGVALPMPIERAEVSLMSGGHLLQSAQWTAFGVPGPGVSCASGSPAPGFTFYVCSYSLGFTTITYVLNAGSVTYYSAEYARRWNGATYDVTEYAFNFTDAPAPLTPLAGDFAFAIQLTTANGEVYAIGGAAPLTPLALNEVEPLTCGTSQAGIYSVYTCTGSSSVFSGVTGSASGSGFASQPAARLTP